MVSVTSIPIDSFDLNIFLVVLSALLFSLIYLFVLRNYKIIKVIQNKE